MRLGKKSWPAYWVVDPTTRYAERHCIELRIRSGSDAETVAPRGYSSGEGQSNSFENRASYGSCETFRGNATDVGEFGQIRRPPTSSGGGCKDQVTIHWRMGRTDGAPNTIMSHYRHALGLGFVENRVRGDDGDGSVLSWGGTTPLN